MVRLRVVVAAVVVLLVACSTGPSSSEIADTVKTGIQENLDTHPKYSGYGLQVQRVQVVHRVGNEYAGLATVETRSGTVREVQVEVTADGDQVLWSIAPGAFLFAAQDSPLP